MPSIKLHPRSEPSSTAITPSPPNPLPKLLHTPSGLAILELQGTIHSPTNNSFADSSNATSTTVGKLVFPNYDLLTSDAGDSSWMKRVYLYVGKHQRLTGEVKKLPKAMAVLRKRPTRVFYKNDRDEEGDVQMNGSDALGEKREQELEVLEIVKYKIVFSTRPEPVSGE